ncbi:hypothetical protein BBB56_15750 [Candidatus Pantoea deserta]|uniref:Uncharacterized protein n=1 Tax=Candidatus Pantoea deserta TaxID=1869313 RepID=A0A3N4P2G0_9GAMM|nr:hypothetical protein [Pantoea deserta]RPD98019.1 hypothetical protein BBB56_15750 [Pantoea deserta]
MNEFYNVLTEHDEVLDGLENSIIAVNLPGRQTAYRLDSDETERLLAAEACPTPETPRFW